MEKGGNHLRFCLWLKQFLCLLKPKGVPDPTYPDIISLGLWFLQYINFWNILGSNWIRPSLYHELIEDKQSKDYKPKCAKKSILKIHVTLSMSCDIENLTATLHKYQLKLSMMGNQDTPRERPPRKRQWKPISLSKLLNWWDGSHTIK